MTGGQVAFEWDDATGILTVVYAGEVQDAQVIGFYKALFAERPALGPCSVLIDSRYSSWMPKTETVAMISEMAQAATGGRGRRIAVVRPERAQTINASRARIMEQAFGEDVVRYFYGLEEARRWLQEPP